jgi:hypothetical protein
MAAEVPMAECNKQVGLSFFKYKWKEFEMKFLKIK